jgi:hypothetical protein
MTAMPLLAVAEDEPPGLADMWVVTPKSGHTAEFEEALKAHLAFRAENGDTRDWQVFTVAAGDDMSSYYIRYCCFDWPDQDAYMALAKEKGMGEHWNENVNGVVDRYQHYFVSLDHENSRWPDDAGDFSLFGVTDWTPRPGTAAKRRAAISKEHGWDRIWAWSWRIGGDDQLSLVIPYKDYSAMVPPEQTFYEFMVEHVGEEKAAQTFEDFSGSFWGSSYTIYAHRPDLSMSTDD